MLPRYPSFRASAEVLLPHKARLVCALLASVASAFFYGAGLGMARPVLTLLLGSANSPGNDLQSGWDFQVFSREFREVVDLSVLPWPEDPFLQFLLVVTAAYCLGLLSGVTCWIHESLAMSVVCTVAMKWRARVFEAFLRLPVSKTLQRGKGDYLSRLVTDVQILSYGYQSILGGCVGHLMRSAAAIILALLVEWRLTVLALASVPAGFLLLRRVNAAVRKAVNKTLCGHGNLLAVAQQALLGNATVKLHCAEAQELERFNRENEALKTEELSVHTTRAFGRPAVEACMLLGLAFAASAAAWLVFRKHVDAISFVTVIIVLISASRSIGPLASLTHDVSQADAAAERLIEVTRQETEYPLAEGKSPILIRHRGSIGFENVEFFYPEATERALGPISFQVQSGQNVAIVGRNGSGKSTILNLLPRLLEVSQGRIVVDGIDIREMDLKHLRGQIGFVSQETGLFSGTIAENIGYGLKDVSTSQVEAAAQAAHASEFIDRLPDRFDTVLGEQGVGLSVGQKKRIAIARALMRDPSILLLDEATSSLDADSEKKIRLALDQIRGKVTVLAVTHRVADAAEADLVVVLDKGQVLATGSHNELMRGCSAYQSLIVDWEKVELDVA